jgi:2,4-dienoyl-CoA reductase (NADPH2)
VVDVRDVLSGAVRPDGEVLVVDELGGPAASSVAELLAERGCAVEVMTSALSVGEELGLTLDLPRWQARAAELGIRQSTDRLVEAVSGDGRAALAVLEHPTGTRSTVDVDWVVLALPGEPADALWHALAGTGLEVHRIGDCLAPRRAHAATIEAERVASAL